MNNSFVMKRIGLEVTTKCTLNCKLCASSIPLLREESFESAETLSEYIKRYFEIADHVELFSITGGEPLLYPQLSSIIKTLKQYEKQYDKVEIITNGTIIPTNDLIDTIKNFNCEFKFLISNYGNHLSKNVGNIEKKLLENNIPYQIMDYANDKMYCGGWVDYGDLSTELYSVEDAKKLFAKCAYPLKLKFCFTINKGIVSPCAGVLRRIINKTATTDEFIDITDDSISIEAQREKIRRIYTADYLNSCQYCNGLCDDSPRFEAAVQLTQEEIKQLQIAKK